MIRTQIQLPERMADQLRQAADRQHVPMAELIRQAVAFFFIANPGADAEDRYVRAAAVAGRFNSGRSDLSKDHDAQFAEASEQ
jgi:hypothetical protein